MASVLQSLPTGWTVTAGGFVAVLCTLLCVSLVYAWQLRQSLKEMTALRQAERKGRTTAERRLRESAKEKSTDSDTGVSFYSLRGIAIARTPFRDKRGTPRQGSLLRLPCAIELHRWLQPQLTLDGLSDYSHCWILFVFSENTNDYNLRNSSRNLGCKSRVIPPRMPDGKTKVGIFATRAPHRPNPLGLTLVRIESLDLRSGVIHVSGADFVDGTPILDIKPYLPYADSVPSEQQPVRVAPWVRDDCGVLKVDQVRWLDSAQCEFARMLSAAAEEESDQTGARCLQHFDSLQQWKHAMDGVLSFDIRSQNRRKIDFAASSVHGFECVLDGLRVRYQIYSDSEQRTVLDVFRVEWLRTDSE